MGASWPTPAHRTPVEPPVPAVDGLPQELRQPAVGQCAPLGLAVPAVDDLVGLEGDTPQGLATAGARLSGAIVHGEAESELGLRQAARPGALVLPGGAEHTAPGGDPVVRRPPVRGSTSRPCAGSRARAPGSPSRRRSRSAPRCPGAECAWPVPRCRAGRPG